MSLDLGQFFGVVKVISLDRDRDRWMVWDDRALSLGVSGYERYPAFDGAICKPPSWWNTGAGSWGCMMSHLRLVEDFMLSGQSGHLLVFEDDSILGDDFCSVLPVVMEELCGQFDMLYLGGQHFHKEVWPWREAHLDGVVRAANVNRTHAFAIHEDFIRAYYRHLCNYAGYLSRDYPCHIDYHLGSLHDPLTGGGHRIYAVQPWICGQRGGVSRVSYKRNGEMWWRRGEGKVSLGYRGRRK
jgi:hypothetical protein